MNNHSSNSFLVKDDVVYDFLFIGLGAGNSLLLLSLLKHGLLHGKKIAVIEPSQKNNNDKTYCFWSEKNHSIVEDLHPIISHKYDYIKASQSSVQDINHSPYYYIRSLDLYQYMLQKTKEANIGIFREAVLNIHSAGNTHKVQTKENAYTARCIFDSSVKSFPESQEKEISIHQSFYGLHIKCEKKAFEAQEFSMMDFDVDQDQFTQFIYKLPFNEHEALIELTRFGSEKIDITYAKDILEKTIQQKYGNFEIVADETGCIPMTTRQFLASETAGIIYTGASANLIKPSTGYAFKSMYLFAEQLAQKIKEGGLTSLHVNSAPKNSRFRFYDRLLLIILLYWPSQGKRIFTQLFNKQSIQTLFFFLDERTNLVQEVNIFASLPIFPFLRALVVYLKGKNMLRYLIAILTVVTFLFIHHFQPQLGEYYSYLILVLGLFIIGIPHGALDHLLLKTKSESIFRFVGQYLFIIALYLICWKLNSLLSLLVFLLFSSFHFGESEWEEPGLKKTNKNSKTLSFLTGANLLICIIFTHVNESITILNELFLFPAIFTNKLVYLSPYISIVGFLFFAYRIILKKETSLTGLAFLLLLGTQVPLALAFGLYFIFQHSFNAWEHMKSGLGLSSSSMFKKALPFTIGAFVLFAFILQMNKMSFLNEQVLFANFFVFLACISLPHIVLMHYFYKRDLSRQKG
jgi:lycopene beta-cyclase